MDMLREKVSQQFPLRQLDLGYSLLLSLIGKAFILLQLPSIFPLKEVNVLCSSQPCKGWFPLLVNKKIYQSLLFLQFSLLMFLNLLLL